MVPSLSLQAGIREERERSRFTAVTFDHRAHDSPQALTLSQTRLIAAWTCFFPFLKKALSLGFSKTSRHTICSPSSFIHHHHRTSSAPWQYKIILIPFRVVYIYIPIALRTGETEPRARACICADVDAFMYIYLYTHAGSAPPARTPSSAKENPPPRGGGKERERARERGNRRGDKVTAQCIYTIYAHRAAAARALSSLRARARASSPDCYCCCCYCCYYYHSLPATSILRASPPGAKKSESVWERRESERSRAGAGTLTRARVRWRPFTDWLSRARFRERARETTESKRERESARESLTLRIARAPARVGKLRVGVYARELS